MKIFQKIIYIALATGCIAPMSSCKKFVELGAPPTQILFEESYKNDASAQSAVLGLYTAYTSGGTNTNFLTYFNAYPGLSADELQINIADAQSEEFKSNTIVPSTNGMNGVLWSQAYMMIKNTNNAISGLTTSKTLSPAMQNQLLGEAKFLRAFAYFHLVNLYGDVPLPLKDDYSAFENAFLKRSPAAEVWAQIVKDLTEAKALLNSGYTGTSRARVNKYAAATLLARVYLYQRDYINAEIEATEVVNSGVYSLPAPAATFLSNSNEVILQFANNNGFSIQGSIMGSATSSPRFSLLKSTYDSFEANDLRKSNWTVSKSVSGINYYFVNKYKLTSTSTTSVEYDIVLRYAEVYLIRAEARARQTGKLSGAYTDLKFIRDRANLPELSNLVKADQAQLLLAIENENRFEFFGEWGHRWLDLKRTNRVDAVIGALKPTYVPTAALYPIPQAQILINGALTQNLGYPN